MEVIVKILPLREMAEVLLEEGEKAFAYFEDDGKRNEIMLVVYREAA
jgi:hypothetical protein